MPSAASDLALLEAAARDAGAIARAHYGKPVETWSKGAAGPVTEIDLAIDKMLRQRLLEARPDYGWLSEESVDDPIRMRSERLFVVDPIDGTRAFIERTPQFTISIGLVAEQRACAGAVYNPITDEMVVGQIGVGVTLNGEPASVSDCDRLEGATLFAKKRFFDADKWPRPWPALKVSWRHSIAYRLALVAIGRYDGAILTGFKHDWDIAAGAALVQAAGGVVTDPWGAPLKFNQREPRAPGLVAAGPGLHPLLIERLASLPDPRARAIEDAAS